MYAKLKSFVKKSKKEHDCVPGGLESVSLELDPALVDHAGACRQRTTGNEAAHLDIALEMTKGQMTKGQVVCHTP